MSAEQIMFLTWLFSYQLHFSVLKLCVTSWGRREGVAAAGVGSKHTDRGDLEAAHGHHVQMTRAMR